MAPDGPSGTITPMSDPNRYFFDNGLRFSCTQCGKCCTGAPGKVHVTASEAAGLAAHLGLTVPVFTARHMRLLDGELLLREKPNGDCIFFDRGCTVYLARPRQCRTYPFWIQNLRSEDAWRSTCTDCEGCGQGRLYTREEILENL